MKKIIAIVITIIMSLTLVVPVMAAPGDEGSVTINGISTNSTYELYKLLELESYNVTSGAYSYKVNSAWNAFFATAEAQNYIVIDGAGYVTWKAAEDDDTIAAFAKIALAYAKDNSIAPVKSSKNPGDFVVAGDSGKFSGLELGYYLVDSTVGALCGLTTTNPDAYIVAKNVIPTIDKQVEEDLTHQWGDVCTADIGQVINFRVTINVHAGAENYVLYDKFPTGLTFQGISTIDHIKSGGISSSLTLDTDYTIETGAGLPDGASMSIRFSKNFCDSLDTNDKVIVYYTAMLNRNAVIAGAGNVNTAWLTFGEGNKSAEDFTTTYTYAIDIVKTDSQNTLIDGAEFKIYDALTGGSEVKVVLMDDGVTYRRARDDESGISIVVKDGKVRVVGFDNGIYYLEETVAPSGYNKLTSRHKFTISDANLDSVFTDGIYSTGSGVQVINKTGSMLPETGGLGTTLFIVVGGMAVLCAGVLLFAKKRMSQIAE